MITNYVSKREIFSKKGGVHTASFAAPQLKRNITIRTALSRVNAVSRRFRVHRWPCSI